MNVGIFTLKQDWICEENIEDAQIYYFYIKSMKEIDPLLAQACMHSAFVENDGALLTYPHPLPALASLLLLGACALHKP